ncbi:MAG: Ig domain-containing protein [Balneolaceae bacterium]
MTNKRLLSASLLTVFLVLGAAGVATAQWTQDVRERLDIPDIINIESSATHLYVLSQEEGLVVFRAHSDSLQWLYSSTGMQRRGNKLNADVRFAYLYGQGRRLTVVEPTSILGVYSSTVLPAPPVDVQRLGNELFIAMGNGELGTLSLESPESVDSPPEPFDPGRFQNNRVQSLAGNNHRDLYVLSGDTHLDLYVRDASAGSVSHQQRIQLNRPLARIFLTEGELIGSDSRGRIYLINADGSLREIADVRHSVVNLHYRDRDQTLIVSTSERDLWIGAPGESFTRWKDDPEAGNLFTVTGDKLWITEFNSLFPVIESSGQTATSSASPANGRLTLKEIPNRTLPFPRALLVPIEFESLPGDRTSINLSYTGSVDNARIRGNSLHWQPRANQTGQQTFRVTATTADGQSHSVEFTVDLRPFNAPPRFSPAREVSIPVGDVFDFEIRAVDPDGPNRNLIRYLGVDLPSGATLNERTGQFRWTPNIRQVGQHRFQVIATDQFGAAASQEYSLRVVEVEQAEGDDDALFDSDNDSL